MPPIKSPDGKHTATWRWGGEMWMSGPEWGYLAVDGNEEIKGASDKILWSEDSQYLAFVHLNVQNIPNNRGAEGMHFRVGILKFPERKIHYCMGNLNLSEIMLNAFCGKSLSVSVNGADREIMLNDIQWV